jgi:signal transduction histidine kinase
MVVVAFSLPLALLVQELARDRAITATEREANSLATTLAVVNEPSQGLLDALVNSSREGVTLSVLGTTGALAGTGVFEPDLYETARSGAAISSDELGGYATYVPVVSGSGVALVVRGWVGPDRLTENVRLVWLVLGGLGILLMVVAAGLADRLGRNVVRSVAELAHAANSVAAGSLDVQLVPSGPPEVSAVGVAFNRLVGRVGDLLAEERESVADLSHRLRTPLTALRLDAEGLGDVAGAAEVRDDVANLERAVDHLIDEARRPMRSAGGVVTDLVTVVRDRVEFWEPLTADQDRDVTVHLPAHPVPVASSATDLAAAIDALIGNIVAHTDEGVSYSISVDDVPVPTLTVTDDGDGFASLDVQDRGVSGTGGSGLGLDIVRRTAEESGGSMSIENNRRGGAAVVVRFGESG